MIKIGNYNKLKLKKITKMCAWLEGEGKDIQMAKKELPPSIKEGESLEVFVFNDTIDTLAATTMEPAAIVNQFAYLIVKSITKYGAFLEWGIKKDLFLPERKQTTDIAKGEKILIRVIMNYENDGVMADMNWEEYLEDDISDKLKEGDKVSLIAMETSNLGTSVLVDNKYQGLVYASEVYKVPYIGQRLTGYVLKIREDGKLDISFKRKGYSSVVDTKDVVLEALKKAGGFLPLHDKSDPEEIKNALNISKKLFKKSTGNLYKKGLITITDEGIKLKKKSK